MDFKVTSDLVWFFYLKKIIVLLSPDDDSTQLSAVHARLGMRRTRTDGARNTGRAGAAKGGGRTLPACPPTRNIQHSITLYTFLRILLTHIITEVRVIVVLTMAIAESSLL
jgi:hypothetical protein